MSTADDLLNAMQSYKRIWMELNQQQPGYYVHPRMQRYVRDATELSQNPYIYPQDMEQLYNEALYNVGGRRRRGSMRRGGRRRPGGGRRPGRPFRRRRFRRFARPFRFRPMMVYPTYSTTQSFVLENLAQKINTLWTQLRNQKRWRKTAPSDMRSPRIFFSLYPLP